MLSLSMYLETLAYHLNKEKLAGQERADIILPLKGWGSKMGCDECESEKKGDQLARLGAHMKTKSSWRE